MSAPAAAFSESSDILTETFDPTQLVVKVFLARFGADYDRNLAKGMEPFHPEVWYSFGAREDFRPKVSVLVGVSHTVVGLGRYLSRIASDFSLDVDGIVAITAQPRLIEDLDRDYLKNAGWKPCDVPHSLEELEFGFSDDRGDQQTLIGIS